MGKEMSKILPGLYIGKLENAQNDTDMMANCITHVLSIHEPVKQKINKSNSYDYCNVNVKDLENVCISKYFSKTTDYIHNARCNGGNILVHCLAGVSRAPTVVMAYIMTVYEMNFHDTYNCIRAVRQNIKPNPGFLLQLQEFETSEALVDERARILEKYGDWKNMEEDRKILYEFSNQFKIKMDDEYFIDSSLDSATDNTGNPLTLSSDSSHRNHPNYINTHTNSEGVTPTVLASPDYDSNIFFTDNADGNLGMGDGLGLLVGESSNLSIHDKLGGGDNVAGESTNEFTGLRGNGDNDNDQFRFGLLRRDEESSSDEKVDDEEDEDDEDDDCKEIPGSIPINRTRNQLGFTSMTVGSRDDFRGRVHSQRSRHSGYNGDGDSMSRNFRKTSVPTKQNNDQNIAPPISANITQTNRNFGNNNNNDRSSRYGQTVPVSSNLYFS